MRAERHRGDAHFVLLLDHFERAERIALIGPLHGKLGAGDQVVDVRQHAVEAVIDGVHVHGDGHSGGAGDCGGVLHGGRIVPVDVQQARAGDLLRRDLRRLDAQAVVAAPEHGALAGGPVDDDVRRLIGAALAHLHVLQVDAGGLQALHLDAAALVVAHGADVLGSQAERAQVTMALATCPPGLRISC